MADNKTREKPSKLKNILLAEGSQFVPFGFMFKRVNKYLGMQKKDEDTSPLEKANMLRRVVFNSAFSILGTLYTVGALTSGTNPLDPKKVLSEAIVTNEEERQRISEEFYRIDTDGNYIIDPNEFYKYRRPNSR